MNRDDEQQRIADSFEYAKNTLDELIEGMKKDAVEYNKNMARDKICGGLFDKPSLGAFDKIRKKKDEDGKKDDSGKGDGGKGDDGNSDDGNNDDGNSDGGNGT